MINTIKAAIVAWGATWYPAGQGPETPVEFEQRAEVVAKAIDTIVKQYPFEQSSFAALITNTWGWESGWDWHVHAGLESPIGHQDYGKARCLGQLHRTGFITQERWDQLAGHSYEATLRCASATAEAFKHHAQRCLRKNAPRGGNKWKEPFTRWETLQLMSAYATGHGCGVIDKAVQRYASYRKLQLKFERADDVS